MRQALRVAASVAGLLLAIQFAQFSVVARAQSADTVLLHVPVVKQDLPLDCESAALASALEYKGIDISQDAVFSELPNDLRPAQASNGLPVRWGDPYAAFVGNVRGSIWNLTGYGVYYPPIAAVANRNGSVTDAYEGWTLEQLVAQLRAGNPVVVLVPWHLSAASVSYYTAFDGRQVWYSKTDHAQVLIGYDGSASTITLMDPISGNYQTYPSSLFMTRFNAFHADGVAVKGRVASQPSSVVYGNSINTFARGADGTLNNFWNVGGRWYSQSLGGSLAGDPSAVVYQDSINVFARGSDGTLDNYWNVGGSWYLQSLAARPIGDPAAVVYENSVNVFVAGVDGTLDNYWNVGGRWYGQSLGGSPIGDPAALVLGASINVFTTGADATLNNYFYAAGRWYGQSLGGQLSSDPAAVVYNNAVEVFARMRDHTLENYSSAGGWSQRNLGGAVASEPSAVVYGSSVRVFATGVDWALLQYSNAGGAWHTQSLGGSLAGPPSPVVYGASVNVFAAGNDRTLDNYWESGGAWYEQSLGGTF